MVQNRNSPAPAYRLRAVTTQLHTYDPTSVFPAGIADRFIFEIHKPSLLRSIVQTLAWSNMANATLDTRAPVIRNMYQGAWSLFTVTGQHMPMKHQLLTLRGEKDWRDYDMSDIEIPPGRYVILTDYVVYDSVTLEILERI